MGVSEAIFDFVAESARVDRTRIHPDTRIREDLGLDGDSAVDFFANFSARFEVDVQPIHQNWQRYFLLPQAGLGLRWLAIGAVAFVAAGFLRQAGILPLLWTFSLLLACGVVWYRPGTRDWRLGVASVVSALAAYAIHRQFPQIPEWAAVPLFLLAFWEIERRIPRRETAPIFVRDLVDSAATGKWVEGDGTLKA